MHTKAFYDLPMKGVLEDDLPGEQLNSFGRGLSGDLVGRRKLWSELRSNSSKSFILDDSFCRVCII